MASASLPKAPGAQCEGCPGAKRPCVLPEPVPPGTRPKLAVVGEGPGRDELVEGRPFIGRSGRMMARALGSIGLKRHEVHWTNAVLCDVSKPKLPDARKACAERLRLELAAAGAPVVLPLGALGARSSLLATKSTPIIKWRGSVSRVSYGDSTQAATPPNPKASGPGESPAAAAWVLPTIHPAFVMRSPEWMWVFKIDIARVGRVMRAGFTPPEEQEGRRFVIARTHVELEEGLHAMSREDDSGFDVETVGLGPMRTSLVCFALSDTRTTTIIPWSSRRDGTSPWWPQADRIAREVSGFWERRRVVTHNGPAFDHIIAWRYELEIREWEDTLLAAHATHPELKKNLAHVVTTGLDVPPWKQQEDRTADLPRLWTYNGRDSLYMQLRWAQGLRQEVGA